MGGRQRLASGRGDLPLAPIVRVNEPVGVRVDEHQARVEPRQTELPRDLFARHWPVFDQRAEYIIQRYESVVIAVFRHPLSTRGYGHRARLGKREPSDRQRWPAA